MNGFKLINNSELNCNSSCPQNQVQFDRKRLPKHSWSLLDPIPSEEIQNNPLQFFSSLSPKRLRIVNEMFLWNGKYVRLYFSQSTLAKYCHASRGWTNQLFKQLTQLGIVAKDYRHMTSSHYKVSSFFSNPSVRRSLASVLPAFRFLCISMLLSAATATNSKNGSVAQNLTQREPRILGFINNREGQGVRERKKGDKMAYEQMMSDNIIQPFESNPISPTIKGIKFLNLTLWGQIKLCAFDDLIIKEAVLVCIGQKKEVGFNYLFKMCLTLSKTNGVLPDWSWMGTLSRLHKMPKDPEMVHKKVIFRTTQKSTKSHAKYPYPIDHRPGVKTFHSNKDIAENERSGKLPMYQIPERIKMTDQEIELERQKLAIARQTDAWKAMERLIGCDFIPPVADTRSVYENPSTSSLSEVILLNSPEELARRKNERMEKIRNGTYKR